MTTSSTNMATMLFSAGILLFAVGLPANGLAGEHPGLVKVETAYCTVCHDDLLNEQRNVHAPALWDCTSCHDVTIAEEGTRVELADEEPALCLSCHAELEPAVAGELDSPHYPVTESCLGCHDPHAAAAANLLAGSQTELCGTCHEIDALQQSHGDQLTRTVDCASCHAPHGSSNPTMLVGSHRHHPFAEGSCTACHREPSGDRVRLRARGERLCAGCHGDLLAAPEGNGTVHQAMKGQRGRAGCLSCHDPHMSDRSSLLTASGPELCAGCHAPHAAAAAAATGHAPAADDCVSCHRPHTSEQVALLEAPAEELCRMCHDAEDEALIGVHLGADLIALDCLSCHTPHGSENPGLLAEVLHPPVLDGCDTCHDGSAQRLTSDDVSDLCLVCHDDVGESARKAKVSHAAFEIASCVDCHNPHASAQASLVKSPAGGVCTDCHEDQAAGVGEVAHGVIELFGCEACHQPHGSENPGLLRMEGPELCLSCHDPSRLPRPGADGSVSLLGRFELTAAAARAAASLRLSPDGRQGHPVPRHRVLGTPTEEELTRAGVESTFAGELSCLTCHDPHKGRSEDIFRWEAASSMQLCVKCHPK